jgi:hypothetical protein
MRKYRVTLTSEAVGTMQHHPVATWYDTAQRQAEDWANNHPEHGKYGPWVGSNVDVAA